MDMLDILIIERVALASGSSQKRDAELADPIYSPDLASQPSPVRPNLLLRDIEPSRRRFKAEVHMGNASRTSEWRRIGCTSLEKFPVN